jgi:hypothetical protein
VPLFEPVDAALDHVAEWYAAGSKASGRPGRAAVRHHGSSEALVSDGGGVFTAKQAQAVYAALGIRKERIATRQAWKNQFESQVYVITPSVRPRPGGLGR